MVKNRIMRLGWGGGWRRRGVGHCGGFVDLPPRVRVGGVKWISLLIHFSWVLPLRVERAPLPECMTSCFDSLLSLIIEERGWGRAVVKLLVRHTLVTLSTHPCI